MKNLKVHPIPLCRTDGKYEKPRWTYMSGFGQDGHQNYYAWFIEGAEEKILIDTGATAEMSIARGRSRDQITHLQTLAEGLSKLGLKPSNIDTVIITHLHWDHVGLAHQLVNAKFIVQKDELNYALDPHPVHVLPAQTKAHALYEKELFEGLDFEVVDGDKQVTKGVKVFLTPGHSHGGQSVAVETKKGIAVVTGFCCIQENFEPREEIRKQTPIVLCGMFINATQLYDSMLKVKEIADIIIPSHEPKFASIDTIP